ncbi:MAG: ComEC/Rec2 family competence protein [Nonlabens sp.]
MPKFSYPFYKFLVAFIAGILLSYYTSITCYQLIIAGALVIIAGALAYSFNRFSSFSKAVFGLCVMAVFSLMGAASYLLRSDSHQVDHITNLELNDDSQLVELQLTQQLPVNSYNNRFYARILGVDGKQVTGNVLVLFNKQDSLVQNVGDRLLVYSKLGLPPAARNYGDFDYRKYLASINVYAQTYVNRQQVLLTKQIDVDLSPIIAFRMRLLTLLRNSGLEDEPRAMIEALILGQRQNIDPEITKSFRDAGVIHILALSGLHVGIILWILKLLTDPLQRFKRGRLLQTVLLLAFLWSFALLTGMSPSITRSVTMFSFVAVGLNLDKRTSPLHALALSAICLLFYDARLLFQVGFQLSYLAVISIVLIQPVLAGLWSWRNWVKDYVWNLFTVTVSAQIGVAVISAYYFHQFPGLFILGNMMLLPLLPFILGGAILLLCSLLIDLQGLSNLLVDGLNVSLEWIIELIAFISSKQQFLIKGVYLELYEVLLIYIGLFSIVLFLLPSIKKSRREKRERFKPNWGLHIAGLSIALLIFTGAYLELPDDTKSMIVMHQPRSSVVAVTGHKDAMLFSSDIAKKDSLPRISERILQTTLLRNKKLSIQRLSNKLVLDGAHLVIIDSTATYGAIKPFDYVLLSSSPKINLERLLQQSLPKAVISDGSNYRSYVSRWKKTCESLEVPFYNTYETGSIDLKLLN